MRLFSWGIPFSFVCLTAAGQLPLSVGSNYCSVAEKDNLLALARDIVELNHGSCVNQHKHKPTAQKATSPHAPWTHKPRCTPRDHANETYCIYTNSDFANGRGISFFTAPSIAERVLSLPAFTEPGVHDDVNNFSKAPWEVKNIPGRGNGLFATRTLYRGDQILASTPAGVYQSDAFPVDHERGYRYLDIAFKRLPHQTQEKVMLMATHNHGHPIMERINTNAFAGDFEGAPHFLLYPETAKMNHDCRPNAMYFYDPARLIHRTVASRTILPGEEITLTYINILQSRAQRQEVLQGIWGFQCSCSLCSSSAAEIRASDARIAKIHELHSALADWSPGSRASPSMAEELISLYEEEKLHAAVATGYMFAALAYNAVGKREEARRYATRALQSGLVNNGVTTGKNDLEEMKAVRAEPEIHWSFLARKRR